MVNARGRGIKGKLEALKYRFTTGPSSSEVKSVLPTVGEPGIEDSDDVRGYGRYVGITEDSVFPGSPGRTDRVWTDPANDTHAAALHTLSVSDEWQDEEGISGGESPDIASEMDSYVVLVGAAAPVPDSPLPGRAVDGVPRQPILAIPGGPDVPVSSALSLPTTPALHVQDLGDASPVPEDEDVFGVGIGSVNASVMSHGLHPSLTSSHLRAEAGIARMADHAVEASLIALD